MPRKKKGEDWDLSKAEIYKIVNLLDPNNIYVGSTTVGLNERFRGHKDGAKHKTRTSPFHFYMCDIGIENFDIIHIEYPIVKTWQELELRELEVANEFKKKGYKVWNAFTSKEEEAEQLADRMKKFWDGNQEAKENARDRFFKYGCVSRRSNGNTHYWYFSCTINRKQHCKKFNVNVMGEEQAELAAKNYRYEYFKITAEEYENWFNQQNFDKEKIYKMEKKIEEEKKKYKEYFKRTGGKPKPANFNYGTVRKDKNNKWIFSWHENGKKKSKSFAESKWGKKAELLANAMRYKIYDELEDKDNLKQILDDELNPNFLKQNGNFKYGELCRYEFHSGWSWCFRWFDENKKYRSKSYSENKYGPEKAKQLAEEMRETIYSELKNNKDVNSNSD